MSTTTEFKIKKVQKLSAEVQAASALRQGILDGEIPPATRLTEIRMAEQLGVSRATIRTAFHQLAQEGLIDQIPYTGWAVMSLSAHDAWELYTLRASLEALASKLVATGIREKGTTSPAIARLHEVFSDLEVACKSRKRKRIAEADFALHRTIIDLAGHRRLGEQYAMVEQQIRIYIASSDALLDPASIIEQHRPIVTAISAGDVERAVQAAVEHNEQEGGKLVAHLEAQE
ncbi:GntR family transcriptional regulator (plasmid) [Ensifer adhaerens]|uniref:GntR family transcriptional regulator n=1 Tax=Ensifer adhaerens TaxID=106592 RepID=UPI0023A9E069|nr:GntR family transcriptional regulator [Ensifer adhaerens]WDZ79119.1 GntR family transcriptional regulator [Ensifer adhaerens]